MQALIELDSNTNRVLNIVKATYNLKDKGQAIKFVVGHYIESQDDPPLKPEFVKKLLKISKEKGIRVDDFGKRYGI